MGLLSKPVSPLGEFRVEFLTHLTPAAEFPVFAPGGIIQGTTRQLGSNPGRVLLGVKRAREVTRVGIIFEGSTKIPGTNGETRLFGIEDVLWDSAPSKGKAIAKRGSSASDGSSFARVLSTTSSGHVFLFAIKWPLVNYPPSLPAGRSVVQTEYSLKAVVRVSSGEQFISDVLPVEFRPHIDPSIAVKNDPHAMEIQNVVVKDDNGRVLGEASLSNASSEGTLFGQDCQLKLELLIRQADQKYLPRKAKVQVFEIHRCHIPDGTGQEKVFELSHETITFPPDRIKGHKECTVPLRVRISVPGVDLRRGATGLPTLRSGELEVTYKVRVTVPLSHSRFIKTKAIVVECPIVVGNIKAKEKESRRKVPRLVVNSEGEGLWDTRSTNSSTRGVLDARRNIEDWSGTSEVPRVLPCGDIEEDDIL
jgi:hypothetical protein